MAFAYIVVMIVISLLVYEVHNLHHHMGIEVKKSISLYEENKILSDKLDDRVDRIKELNESIGDSYGVKPEVIVETVEIEFDKLERATIQVALASYVSSCDKIDSIRVALKTLDRVNVIFEKASEVEYKNDKAS